MLACLTSLYTGHKNVHNFKNIIDCYSVTLQCKMILSSCLLSKGKVCKSKRTNNWKKVQSWQHKKTSKNMSEFQAALIFTSKRDFCLIDFS